MASDALLAVVLTVSVENPPPPDIEVGLNEQVGGAVVAGEPLSVILLHERVTVRLKPFFCSTVIAEMADAPGEIDAGENAFAEIVKSCTSRETDVLCTSAPDVPVTVTT